MKQTGTILLAPAHIHDQLRIQLAQRDYQPQSVTILTISAFLQRKYNIKQTRLKSFCAIGKL